MADDEYYTHPDRMRGTTRRKQNAMMHQQLKSFDNMLNTFIERYETSSLYRALARVIPYNRQVHSLHVLNHYTNQLYSDRDDSQINDQTIIKRIEKFNQEIQYLKQMKTLFDDRIYSVLFEFYYEMVMEEIPQATKLVERGRRASNEVRGSNLLVMSNIEGYAALSKSMPVEKLYDISKDCEKLFAIIHQLQQIDVRWGSLLKSEEVDVELFDHDSIHDVKKYPNYSRFEAVLRLIPDVIRKTQSAMELAKSWWYQAERIRRRLRGQKIRDDTTSDQPLEHDYSQVDELLDDDEQVPNEDQLTKPYRSSSRHTPEATSNLDEYTNYHDPAPDDRKKERQNIDSDEEGSGRPIERISYDSVDSAPQDEYKPPQSRATPDPEPVIPRHRYPAVIETVERRLKELSTSITLGQMDLAAETNELEFFNRRQQRIRKLRSNLKRAINAMEAMHDELKDYGRIKEKLLLQLEETKVSSERRHVRGNIKNLDEKVKDVQELSQVIEYRHNLMASDLKLELDLKETFTRYQHEARERVDILKSSLQEEEEKRVQLASELRLLRLQTGLDGQDKEYQQSESSSNKVNQNLHQRNRGRSVPRVPNNRVGGIPWLENGRKSLDESYGMDDELENRNRKSFSPDLLLGQPAPADSLSWTREGLRDDRKHLNRTASSPDLLNHTRRTSVDGRVNWNGSTNRDNMARPRESKRKPELTHQMPQTVEKDPHYDSFEDIPNRSLTRHQNQRTSVPEINYFPPSPKGKKKHRTPKAPEESFSDENGSGDDPFGYNNSRNRGLYQENPNPNHSDANGEGRIGQKGRPPPPTLDRELPTKNLNRQPHKSFGLNKKGGQVQKQPPLPQLREEDDPTPAMRKSRTPRMYDPKRESLDSVLSSHSPLLLNSYIPLNYDRGGKGEPRGNGGGGGGSRKAKKAQGLKPKKSDQPDLLSPLYRPNHTQRRKQPRGSRIPIKTTY